jgi:hypothetical protein
MSSSIYQIIRNAILNKQQVIATYDGCLREMCPHVIGHKNGTEQALCYQFAGNTSKGPIKEQSKNNWRCITISKLTNVSVKDGEWYTFENHSRPSTCVDTIDVEVAY